MTRCYRCGSNFQVDWKAVIKVLQAHGLPPEESPRLFILMAHIEHYRQICAGILRAIPNGGVAVVEYFNHDRKKAEEAITALSQWLDAEVVAANKRPRGAT